MSAAKSWRCVAATLILSAVAMFAGCADDLLPTCSDPTAEGLVKQIFFNEIAAQTSLIGPGPAWLDKVKQMSKIKLAMVRTTGTDDQYAKRSCEAELQVQLLNDQRAVAVEYTIQQTDDKKDMLVQMAGHVPLAVAISAAALSPEFIQATAAVPGSSPPEASTPMSPSKPVQTAPAVAAPAVTPAPGLPAVAGPVKTIADVTVDGFECQDLCYLQYKTVQGEVKSAICTEAPVCKQWSGNPSEFKEHVGARATLKLSRQFVPEGGVTLDSVQGLEWRS